jgi:biopolymer transport protein ExbD
MPLKAPPLEDPALNLTPMIDVVFNLIIFFMVCTQFAEQERQYDVELPTVAQAQPLTSQPDQIVINVYGDGRIVVHGSPLTLPELLAELKQARARFADQAVLIRGEGQGLYQRITDVLETCHRAQIRNFSLGVEQRNENLP